MSGAKQQIDGEGFGMKAANISYPVHAILITWLETHPQLLHVEGQTASLVDYVVSYEYRRGWHGLAFLPRGCV